MMQKSNLRSAFVATLLLALAGICVGKPMASSSNPLSECLSNCNMNNGYCQPNGQCNCYDGWEGPNCNQCSLAVGCIYGTCDGPRECNCMEGYGGRYCQLDKQYCERHQPCLNGATCKNDKLGSYECICASGYAGTNCGIKVRTLATAETPKRSCLNGGTCISGDSQNDCKRCTCPKGYAGDRCETRVRMCATRPCANGGRCINLLGDFLCECAEGYRGRFCMDDVDECSILKEDACKNGGSCINRPGSYRCSCPEGFEGSRCDKKTQRLFTTTKETTKSTTMTTKPKLETQTPNAEKPRKNNVAPDIPDFVRPNVNSIEINNIKKTSTNIKVTSVLHKVEVESSNSNAAFVKQVIDGSKVLMSGSNVDGDEASMSVVQAVTFAFLGVAAALFVGIGVFMWFYCSKNGRRVNCFGDSSQHSKKNISKADQQIDRNSRLLEDEFDEIPFEKRSIVKKGCRSKPGLAVRTVTPSSGLKNAAATSRQPHVDCLYVALPENTALPEERVVTVAERDILLSASKLSQSSNSYRY